MVARHTRRVDWLRQIAYAPSLVLLHTFPPNHGCVQPPIQPSIMRDAQAGGQASRLLNSMDCDVAKPDTMRQA